MSGYVALRLPLPGAVVTWFVTGFRISIGYDDPAPMSRLSRGQVGEWFVLGQVVVGAAGDASSLSVVHMCLPGQSVASRSGCPLSRSYW